MIVGAFCPLAEYGLKGLVAPDVVVTSMNVLPCAGAYIGKLKILEASTPGNDLHENSTINVSRIKQFVTYSSGLSSALIIQGLRTCLGCHAMAGSWRTAAPE